MSTTAQTKPGIIVGVLHAVIALATMALFASFAPVQPRAIFWTCMVDIVLIELTTGGSLFRAFSSITGRSRRGALPATNIALASTASIFGLLGIAIDVAFLFWWNTPDYDKILAWLIIGRWLALAAFAVPVLLGDRAHQDARPELAFIQQERRAIIDAFEVTLRLLRHVEVTDAERAMLRHLTDQADGTRNRMRGWASGSTSNDPRRVGELVTALGSQVEIFASVTAGERTVAAEQLKTTLRGLQGELSPSALLQLG